MGKSKGNRKEGKGTDEVEGVDVVGEGEVEEVAAEGDDGGRAEDAATVLSASDGGLVQGEPGGSSSSMGLYHVTHVLEDGGGSATIPFPVLVLYDAIKEKTIPAGLTCRWVLPLQGSGTFVSLWLAKRKDAVQSYVDSLPGCSGSCAVSEVACGHSYGLGPRVGFPALRVAAKGSSADDAFGGMSEAMERMGASMVQSGEEAGRKMGEMGKFAEGAAAKLAEEAGRAAEKLREDAKVAQEGAARVAKEVGESAERSWAGFLSGVASAATAFEQVIHRAAKPGAKETGVLPVSKAQGEVEPEGLEPATPVDTHDVDLDALLEETA